jgi:hypothetical protein
MAKRIEQGDVYVEWIVAGLERPGKSKKGLAIAMQVDPAVITRMVQGRRRIRIEELGLIAGYLGEAPPTEGPNFARSRSGGVFDTAIEEVRARRDALDHTLKTLEALRDGTFIDCLSKMFPPVSSGRNHG